MRPNQKERLRRRAMPMSRRLVLEFPKDVPEEDLKDKQVLMRAKEGAVMELLRKAKISQGRAAELLGISRHDIVDLMGKYDIPVFDATSEELKEGVKNLKSALGGR
jgi:predicted HTH domain antitoxin